MPLEMSHEGVSGIKTCKNSWFSFKVDENQNSQLTMEMPRITVNVPRIMDSIGHSRKAPNT